MSRRAAHRARSRNDGKLWYDVAIWDDSHNDNADAKIAISKAADLEGSKPQYYSPVMAGKLVQFDSVK